MVHIEESGPDAIETVTIRIKYCGGCNAFYDRTALVRDMLDAFERLNCGRVVPVPRDEPADLCLIVCGCPTCCADRPENRQDADRCIVIGPDLVDYQTVLLTQAVDHVCQTVVSALPVDLPE